jgi:catechol 2,3-dioxygenase-like lactoylglutathione lyase family enzyme
MKTFPFFFQLFSFITPAAANAIEKWPPLAKDMPVVRIARPTNDLKRLIPFYRDGLGFDVIAQFENHEGFDGMMFGKEGAPYHFEFTLKKDHKVPNAPSKDNLVVFYLPNKEVYASAIKRMNSAGFDSVRSFNPYWDRGGTTFEDPDGYRVVFFNGAWKK